MGRYDNRDREHETVQAKECGKLAWNRDKMASMFKCLDALPTNLGQRCVGQDECRGNTRCYLRDIAMCYLPIGYKEKDDKERKINIRERAIQNFHQYALDRGCDKVWKFHELAICLKSKPDNVGTECANNDFCHGKTRCKIFKINGGSDKLDKPWHCVLEKNL